MLLAQHRVSLCCLAHLRKSHTHCRVGTWALWKWFVFYFLSFLDKSNQSSILANFHLGWYTKKAPLFMNVYQRFEGLFWGTNPSGKLALQSSSQWHNWDQLWGIISRRIGHESSLQDPADVSEAIAQELSKPSIKDWIGPNTRVCVRKLDCTRDWRNHLPSLGI